MIPRIRKRFLEIYDNPINTSSYRNYYIALCDFIKTNQSLIESDLLDKDLMQILNIDWFLSAKIEDYNIEEIGKRFFDLKNEKCYFQSFTYKHADTLLNTIVYRFWDMLSTSSDFECKCPDGDIRIANDSDETFLYCLYCGRAFALENHRLFRMNEFLL